MQLPPTIRVDITLCAAVWLGMLCSARVCLGDEFHLGQAPSPNGAQQLSFDTWTQMSFVLKNTGEIDKEVLVTTYYDAQPEQQFGRRIWVPAQATRCSWSLVKSPLNSGKSTQPVVLDMQTLVLERDGDNERAVATEQGRRQHAHHNRFSEDSSRMLLIRDPEDDQIIPFVEAVRTNGDSRFHDIVQGDLPETVQAYSGFSHVVLSSSRIRQNLAALDALRGWVSRGGRLWIHIERTGTDILPFLMTESSQLSFIDEIELTSVQIQTPPQSVISTDEVLVELETPLHMLRVAQQDLTVLATIDGWPVALEAAQGVGKILITTSEPLAFYRKTTISEVSARSKTRATRVGESLGRHFFFIDKTQILQQPDWPRLSNAYIGHQIPDKWQVGSLLVAFCLILLCMAAWASRTQGYFQLSIRLPLLAVITAAVLVFVGASSRRGIPSTNANIQLVQADRQGNLVLQGAESTYNNESGADQILVDEAGRLEFLGDLPGAAKRYVLNDRGQSALENINMTSGVYTSTFDFSRSQGPTSASMTFYADGLQGMLNGILPAEPTAGLLVMRGEGNVRSAFRRQVN